MTRKPLTGREAVIAVLQGQTVMGVGAPIGNPFHLSSEYPAKFWLWKLPTDPFAYPIHFEGANGVNGSVGLDWMYARDDFWMEVDNET